MEALIEVGKQYHEFFKANIENLECLNPGELKTENASAGLELEKLISTLKDLLAKPFGKKVEAQVFNPLDLQKDLPDNKAGAGGKPNPFNFMAKGKDNGHTDSGKGNSDLLGLDLLTGSPQGTATQANTTAPASGNTGGKLNAMSFLNKKPTTSTPAAQTSQSQSGGGLLDLDLAVGVSTTTTVGGSGMTGVNGAGIPPHGLNRLPASNFDLLDLSVGVQPLEPLQTNTCITMNSHAPNKGKSNQADLDLMNLMGDFSKP